MWVHLFEAARGEVPLLTRWMQDKYIGKQYDTIKRAVIRVSCPLVGTYQKDMHHNNSVL